MPKEPAVLLFKPSVQVKKKRIGNAGSSSESSPINKDSKSATEEFSRKRKYSKSLSSAENSHLLNHDNHAIMGQCVQFLTNTGKWRFGRLADHDPVSSRFKIVYVDGRPREVWISTSLVKACSQSYGLILNKVVLALSRDVKKMVPALVQAHGRKGSLKVKFYNGSKCQISCKEVQQLEGVDIKSILVEPGSLKLLQEMDKKENAAVESDSTQSIHESTDIATQPLFFKPLVKGISKNTGNENKDDQADEKSSLNSSEIKDCEIPTVQQSPLSSIKTEDKTEGNPECNATTTSRSSSVETDPVVIDSMSSIVDNIERVYSYNQETTAVSTGEVSSSEVFESPLTKKAKADDPSSVVLFTPTISSEEGQATPDGKDTANEEYSIGTTSTPIQSECESKPDGAPDGFDDHPVSDIESISTDGPCYCPYTGCSRVFGRADLLKTHIKYCHAEDSEGKQATKKFKLPYLFVNCPCGMTDITEELVQCEACLCLQHQACVPSTFSGVCDYCLRKRRKNPDFDVDKAIQWFGHRSRPDLPNSIADRVLYTAVDCLAALQQIEAERKKRKKLSAKLRQGSQSAYQSTSECLHSMLTALCTSDVADHGLFDLYRQSLCGSSADQRTTERMNSNEDEQEDPDILEALKNVERRLDEVSPFVDQSCSISKQCLRKKIQTLLERCRR